MNKKQDLIKIISTYGVGEDALSNLGKYNGWYGVSPGYPFFCGDYSRSNIEHYCRCYYSSKRVESVIECGSKQFDNFLIFLGDGLLLYNLMAFCGISHEEASQEALRVGQFMEYYFLRDISNSGHKNVQFQRYYTGTFDDDSNIWLAVKKMYDEDTIFKFDCQSLTEKGAKNKLIHLKKRVTEQQYKDAFQIACSYAVSDLAMSLAIFRKYPIEISKYKLPKVLENIANGIYPCLTSKIGACDIGHMQFQINDDPVYSDFYDDEFGEVVKDAALSK